MSSAKAVLWLVAMVVGLALLLYLLRLARQALDRRARRLRYQRLGRETGPQRLQSQPAALSGSISGQKVAAVQRDAENVARLVAAGAAREPRNPYTEGTAEYVLWVATYHLTLTELSEQAEALEAAREATWQPTRPAPEPGLNRP